MRACMYEPAFDAASCALSAMRRALACAFSLMASMRRSSMKKLLLWCLSLFSVSCCVWVPLLCQRPGAAQTAPLEERGQRLRVTEAAREGIAEPAQPLSRVGKVEVLRVRGALQLRPLERHGDGGGRILSHRVRAD